MTKFKRITAILVAMILCFSLLTMLTACREKADPERRPLTMSIQKPDGVFNPFFSTSAMDSTIIGMTQIGMLTSTKSGEPKCGDDEPVAVKDYKITTADDESYTDYSFIIKNGIKFSDGTPLTIKDVLFNLYIYLDPVYTGSSTIYSTDIRGLKAYRQQNPDITDDDDTSYDDVYIRDAARYVTELVDFVRAFGIYSQTSPSMPVKPDKGNYTEEQILSFWENVGFAAREFRSELETDWNNASVESYKDEGFTEKWQVFLYQDGGIDFYLKDNEGKYVKDSKGNRQVDPEEITYYENQLNEYLRDYKLQNNEESVRSWAINSAYSTYFNVAIDMESGEYKESTFDTKDLNEIQSVMSKINAQSFSSVVNVWQTGNTLLTQVIADLKSEEFGKGDHPVKTVSGITSSLDPDVDQVTEDFHGNALGEPHDVLNIRINNIDPKAIWNFSFNIAPMHYYSGTFNGHNYVEEFDAAEGNFGFKFGDPDFFNQVLNAPEKVGLPVGAGVYKASTPTGGTATTASQFTDGSLVYYERNDNFYTLFGSDTSKNAKIKNFRYKIVESNQVINSIITGDIDIGEPNATPDNADLLKNSDIAHEEVLTSGYGYVGINPRFVPDVHVRRAIMKAMNRNDIKQNYYQELCDIINRPMSRANWASPDLNGPAPIYSTEYTDKNGKTQTVSYEYDPTGMEIEALLESVGYVKGSDGVYSRRLADGSTHRLSYKFTIAGQSTDHPAYAMFIQAQNLLNDHGFDIKVVTSNQALSDLSAGKLAVWAAAWSSTIDPDMYQVYHRDSNATSVNNWGYPQIKANRTLYSFEATVMQDLSDLIDEGRTTNDKDARTRIYSKALDKVMEFAVELPTYQRNDMTAYNDKLLDRNTMTPKSDLSPYNGLISRIWELNYIQ